MSDNIETWEERHARVAARKAAEEALPEPVKELLEVMRPHMLKGNNGLETYRLLKSACVSIWGPK